jgi:hypothetical protein
VRRLNRRNGGSIGGESGSTGGEIAMYMGGKVAQQDVVVVRYAQDNLGVKKVSASSKNPAKCPMICFAREKKNCIPDFQYQRYINSYNSMFHTYSEEIRKVFGGCRITIRNKLYCVQSSI